MKLTRLTAQCPDGVNCPAVYATDRGTLVIRGYRVADADAIHGLSLPEHETVVEVPLTLIREATL